MTNEQRAKSQTDTAMALGRLIISISFFDRYYSYVYRIASGLDFPAADAAIKKLKYETEKIKLIIRTLENSRYPSDQMRHDLTRLMKARLDITEDRNRLMHDSWVVTSTGYSIIPSKASPGFPDEFAPSAVTPEKVEELIKTTQRLTGELMSVLFPERN